MELTIKLFASFAEFLPAGAKKQTMVIEAEDGARVGQVVDQCGIPREECRLMIINGITHTNPAVTMEQELRPGDTLALLPRVH